MFSDEFGFACKRDEKFLPLKCSGKDFDSDKAYKRYAFIKSLERHKEEQQKYEQLLRGDESEHVDSLGTDNQDEGQQHVIESDLDSGDDMDFL